MRKSKRYRQVKFSARILRRLNDGHKSLCSGQGKEQSISSARVGIGDEEWSFDTLDEFFTAYSANNVTMAELIMSGGSPLNLNIYFARGETDIAVRAESRSSIEAIFSVVEEAPPDDKIVIEARRSNSDITIFIGHGRNNQWQRLNSHLQDKHELNVVSYESGARAGHTIRDILDSMATEASLAFLVLTGEDKSEDGIRARQNVIHECGLFQGRLGFDKAILLVEKGVKLASNFDGIQQLRFNKGRISEIFGDAIATIRREFGPV